MEPLPGSADGPKTPLSPRTRSGMSRIDREKKIGHRRVGEAGEVTYKKVKRPCVSMLHYDAANKHL